MLSGPAATQIWKYFPFKTEIKRLLWGHSKLSKDFFSNENELGFFGSAPLDLHGLRFPVLLYPVG